MRSAIVNVEREGKVIKPDTKGNWVRLMAERLRGEGKSREEAQRLAEESWSTYFGKKFIGAEYEMSNDVTITEEQS